MCRIRDNGQKKSHDAALGEEKGAFPKASLRQRDAVLRSRRQTEKGCESFWDAEHLDGDLVSCRGTRIASQPLLKVETIMRALRTGKRRRRGVRAHGESLLHLHLEVLAAQRQARTSMVPTTPVPPEERFRPDNEWMQQHAHLARLGGGAALPLTLLPQRAGAATADAGRIDYAQTPIGFAASLVRHKRLAGGATECAIGLEGKVLTREAALFPG